jgi:hypothetical protein
MTSKDAEIDNHDNKDAAHHSISKANSSIPWRLHLLICCVGIIIVSIMSYGFHLGNSMILKYTPLIDAAMEIRLEATTAHLVFEEILSGDTFEDMEAVQKHLDQSLWYATAMLEGGENPQGRYVPLDDPVMIGELEDIIQKINKIRQMFGERIDSFHDSGSVSVIDHKYDSIFRSFQHQADIVERQLQAEVQKKYVFLKTIQIELIIISFLSMGFIIWLIHRFERQRSSHLKQIDEANTRLEKALHEVKTLQGIIPICSYCKKIRDEKGLWDQLESYVLTHTEAEFSHGACPECFKKQMEEFEKKA